MTINKNGFEIDYYNSVSYMDDDIREDLHFKLAPCCEQEFFTAYENAHEKKFNEEWFLSERYPTW